MKTRLTSVCICAALCVMIGIGFAGCGKTAKKDLTPTQTVEVFLDAFKADDEETMNQVYLGDGNDFMPGYGSEEEESDSDLTQTMQTELMSKWRDFDYKVTDEKIADDGKTATVDVEITTYSMIDVFNNFYQEYMTQALEQFSGNSNNVTNEDYEQMAVKILKEQIDKATEKDYTGTAKLTLTKTDGRWMVDKIGSEDSDFLNAISGGMMTVLQDVVDTQGLDDGEDTDKEDKAKDKSEGEDQKE